METLCGDQSCRTHLSFNPFILFFIQFVDLWTFQQGKRLLCLLQSSPGPGEAQSTSPAPGPVCGEGTRVACRSREQGKATPPQSTPAQKPVQCARSMLLYQGDEAAGRLGEALGHSGGWHSDAEELQPEQSHSHSSLSRVSDCKGPVSQIQQGKGHGQPLKGRSGSQLCVLWPWYTPCPGHSIGSCPPKPRAP